MYASGMDRPYAGDFLMMEKFNQSFVEVSNPKSEEFLDGIDFILKPIRERLGKQSGESMVASYGLDIEEFLKTDGVYPVD